MAKVKANKYTTNMFEGIKESLLKQKSGGGSFQDILRTVPVNSYLVRLLPNLETPEDTFYHYYDHSWRSKLTGRFTQVLCPTTWGERCPICEERFRLYEAGSTESKAQSNEIKRKEHRMVNVYVVNDPTNAENNGNIKVLRYGKQIHDIIIEAIEGEDSDQFGPKVFDLTEDGCNFRIKVEKATEGNTTWPRYTSSKFLIASEIPELTTARISEIQESLVKLDEINESKTYDELKETLNEHFLNVSSSVQPGTEFNTANDDDDDDDDDDDKTSESKTSESKVSESDETSSNDDDNDDDDVDKKIEQLLEDL